MKLNDFLKNSDLSLPNCQEFQAVKNQFPEGTLPVFCSPSKATLIFVQIVTDLAVL